MYVVCRYVCPSYAANLKFSTQKTDTILSLEWPVLPAWQCGSVAVWVATVLPPSWSAPEQGRASHTRPDLCLLTHCLRFSNGSVLYQQNGVYFNFISRTLTLHSFQKILINKLNLIRVRAILSQAFSLFNQKGKKNKKFVTPNEIFTLSRGISCRRLEFPFLTKAFRGILIDLKVFHIFGL